MTECKELKECIACGNTHIKSLFDLGEQPLANSYKIIANQEEKTFPLGVNYCPECYHVQLTHIVNPDLLFKDYAYMSGVSKTMLNFFEWFAQMSVDKFQTKPNNVLDIGCNDASQLDYYKKLGLETWGVDPAENLHKVTSQRHNIICDYFREGLTDKKFDLVTIQNAFAHNYNQLDMLLAAKSVLSDDGLLFIQTSQGDMILNGEFDTIYHEHISFYNIKSMSKLCDRAGVNLVDVVRHPIHGNSYIFIISKTKSNTEHLENLISKEEELGLYSDNKMEEFRNKAIETKDEIVKFINECHEKNIPVIGFGAPAKGNTFMNYSKIKPKFIIDETPLKRNKFTPGMSISIEGIEGFDKIENHKQVCFVIFAWNFYDEIKEKIVRQRSLFTKLGERNDIFVSYFPKVKVE